MSDAKKNKPAVHKIRAGRPPIPPELKKVQLGVALPRWLIEWLDEQEYSRASIIEDALCRRHKLKPPKKI